MDDLEVIVDVRRPHSGMTGSKGWHVKGTAKQKAFDPLYSLFIPGPAMTADRINRSAGQTVDVVSLATAKDRSWHSPRRRRAIRKGPHERQHEKTAIAAGTARTSTEEGSPTRATKDRRPRSGSIEWF